MKKYTPDTTELIEPHKIKDQFSGDFVFRLYKKLLHVSATKLSLLISLKLTLNKKEQHQNN